MKIRRDIFSFRNRVVVIIVGVSLGMVSLLYTNNMAKRLKEKEQHDVALWAHAMERANRNVMGGSMEDPLITDIVSNGNNIPFIMTNENLEVLQFHLVPEKIIDHPDRLRRQIDKFTAENTPRTVRFWWSNDHYHIIFYGRSALLKSLYYFPYVQILVIRPLSCWGSSHSGLRNTTSRTGCGSGWRRRRHTNWAPPPRRCSGGSNTCARRTWIRAPWRR